MSNKIWVLTYTIGTNEGRKSRRLICDTKEQAIMQQTVLGGDLVEYIRQPESFQVNWPEKIDIDEELEKEKQSIAELESRTATAAADDVLAERKRQVTAEGWTPGHDDEYEHGELADAAGCYALSSELFDCAGEPPIQWPWPDEWWKPTNRRRDLVKAGALILAEIERLDRASGIKVEAE